MNFDTRTIIDLIKLDEDLTEDLRYTIVEEQRFSEKIQQYDYDIFVDSISLLLRDKIKFFLKNKLKQIGLPILKGLVKIENIDYKVFVNEIQKNNT
jgi:hypothetical protein